MKKLLVFMIALTMVLAITACGNGEPEIEEIAPLPEPEPEPIVQVEPEPEPEIEPEEEYGLAYVEENIYMDDPIDPDALADLGDFRFGTIDGNTFESEWLGLRVVVSDSYNMWTQEELFARGMDLGVEVLELEGEEFAEALSEVWMPYLMLARQAIDDQSTLMIAVDRKLLTRDMTIEQWIEAFLELSVVEWNWEPEFHDNLERVERWGQEWYTFSITDRAWTYLYFIQRIDNKMVYIQIGANSELEYRFQEMLDGFSEF